MISEEAERVKIVSEAFHYTEAYAAYHQSRVDLISATFNGSLELATSLKHYKEAKEAFKELGSAHCY